MKVFISADIEGITGINNWDETHYAKPEYAYFRNQMNLEVIAACEGALAAGATEIVVRDAHGASKNLDASRLPRQATLIRGWSGHPYSMVQGIDDSFAACMMIGYHARAGEAGNPLSHTMATAYAELRLNGKGLSEFAIHALAAELEGVPTVFVSGDLTICEDVWTWQENIVTVPTTTHFGQTTQALAHPEVICEKIKTGASAALAADRRERCHLPLASDFVLEIEYKDPARAYRSSFYPGARLIGDRTLQIQNSNYMEILRAIAFV